MNSLKRSRLRKAGEKISENSSLRDNLVDEQANQLLNWGLTRLEKTVEQTLEQPDEQAEPTLESDSDAVRQAMKKINDLSLSLPQIDDGQAWTQLLALVENLYQVSRDPAGEEDKVIHLEQLINNRQTLSQAQIFAYLMEIAQT